MQESEDEIKEIPKDAVKDDLMGLPVEPTGNVSHFFLLERFLLLVHKLQIFIIIQLIYFNLMFNLMFSFFFNDFCCCFISLKCSLIY